MRLLTEFLAQRPHFSFWYNAASMRGYGMKAQPQCSRCRRAWPCYAQFSNFTDFCKHDNYRALGDKALKIFSLRQDGKHL